MVREIKDVSKLRLLTVSRVIVEKDGNLNFNKVKVINYKVSNIGR